METKKSFADFLIKTGLKPLVLIGQSIQFFGKGIVVSFLLGAGCGAISLYVFSNVGGGVIHNYLFPGKSKVSSSQETLQITGQVKDWKDNPLKMSATAYFVPLEDQKPINEGIVDLKIPKGDYKVFIVTERDRNNYATTEIVESDPHTHSLNLKLPPGVGGLQGQVIDADKNPKKGKFVCIYGGLLPESRCTKTDSSGKYKFSAIPASAIGMGYLTIREEQSGQEVRLETIQPYTNENYAPDIELPKQIDPIITGVVKDRRGQPVANVWVSIDRRYGTITSYDGRFRISIPSFGTHTIEVGAGDRPYYKKSINVNTKTFSYDIQLR